MATLAAMFRRIEPVLPLEQPAPARLRSAEADFQLRPLPNEDVYFYSKRIDNTRLVREADPAARRRCWRAVGICSVAAVYLILLLLPNVMGRIAGSQLYTLERQHEQLQNQKAALELEEASLLSPERMQELARTLQLVDPMPSQLQLLNPTAEGRIALNNPRK